MAMAHAVGAPPPLPPPSLVIRALITTGKHWHAVVGLVRHQRMKMLHTSRCKRNLLFWCTSTTVAAAGAPHQQQHASQEQPLLEPFKIGGFQLTDRIVYAPLTRCRAIDNVPSTAAIEYYAQRARTGGFIISEATVTSPTGYGCWPLALLTFRSCSWTLFMHCPPNVLP